MLCVYELYDLHFILIAIRSYPCNPINKDVVLKIITVLNNRLINNEVNQFRKALQSIESITENKIYDFVFSENKYTYYPLSFLKDERIYRVLLTVCEELLVALDQKNRERVVDLTDCLHNLPILLVENQYLIPKEFWNKIVKCYRKRWNADFLQVEQLSLKRHLQYKSFNSIKQTIYKSN